MPESAFTFVQNQRRNELIHRKYLGGGLSETETNELAALQSHLEAEVDRLCPIPPEKREEVEISFR